MRTPALNEQRLCRTCRADITLHAQYTRWTQCSVCYWRARFERYEPLHVLTKRLGEFRARQAILEDLIPKLYKSLQNYEAELRASTPWIRRVFGLPSDAQLDTLSKELLDLREEQYELPDKLRVAEIAIEEAQNARKRLMQAELSRNAAEHRAKEEQRERDSYANRSYESIDEPFDRLLFLIQPRDYRRGNAIDNYCRTTLQEAVLSAFQNRCAFCGCAQDLTLDHYGLTKNEGGNFILITSDKQSLRINVVVLCRACNSMKGQRSHFLFFDESRRAVISECHARFLSFVLADERLLKLLKKWGQPK